MSKAADLDLAFDKFEAGDLRGALQICSALLTDDPDHYGALYLSGSILASLGRIAEAIEYLKKATDVGPQKKVAWFNLAKLYTDQRSFGAAQDCIRAYLALDDEDAEAIALLGTILSERGEFRDAEEAFGRALARAPDLAEAWFNRGNLFKAQSRFEDAIADYRKALSLDMSRVVFYINLGVAFHAMERFVEAIEAYDAALELDPKCVDAWSNRGISLHFMERFEEAVHSYTKALSLVPDHSEARINRAYTRLLLGDFAGGWDDYESRLKSRDYARIALGQNAWVTELIRPAPKLQDVVGRQVFLFGEQGAGDNIMFASLLDDLLRVSAKVSLVVDARLCALFRDNFPNAEVIAVESFSKEKLSAGAVCLLIGSLGSLFRREANTFPHRAYLKADLRKVETFQQRVHAQERKRIGISWLGGLAHTRHAARSLALEDMLELLAHRSDLAFVSLQHGQNRKEVHATAERVGVDVQTFAPNELNDFSDLAALITSLDAVVTVQNTNVHVSGALGVPCFAILPTVPEWRYALTGERMPWYGSVRLFRRGSSGGLQATASELRNKLDTVLA